MGVDNTKVTTGPYVSTYVRDYLLANGGKTTSTSTYCLVDLDASGNVLMVKLLLLLEAHLKVSFYL